jgi:hypothetical protein
MASTVVPYRHDMALRNSECIDQCVECAAVQQ